MLGLKRGTVALLPHQEEWHKNARDAIETLKECFGDAAIDIQHVGSTAIEGIHAKPILDIAVGVRKLADAECKTDDLEQNGILFRGEDVPGQLLFVMGDFENDIRTHHIHVVIFEGVAWRNYLNFRDYLNAFPEKAREYDRLKLSLIKNCTNDRKGYTSGKQELIDRLLEKARIWRSANIQG